MHWMASPGRPLPQADGYVLKHILHDWDDADVRAILRNIRCAAPSEARLLIAETLLPEGSDFHPALLMDITMLAILGGRERTRAEFRLLLADSGFRLTNVVPVEGLGGISILEARPVRARLRRRRLAWLEHGRYFAYELDDIAYIYGVEVERPFSLICSVKASSLGGTTLGMEKSLHFEVMHAVDAIIVKCGGTVDRSKDIHGARRRSAVILRSASICPYKECTSCATALLHRSRCRAICPRCHHAEPLERLGAGSISDCLA